MHPNFDTFEVLGRGNDTVVYRGLDRQLERYVAIKELESSARKNKRRLEMFIKEARFLANVDHPNVLKVYSVDDTLGWIVMELMEGTIAQKVKTAAMAPEQVRSILSQMLNALNYLHGKQKLHGKVRPSNILINDQGQVKLSEFESTDIGTELPVPDGAKKYLAPELLNSQVFGQAGPQLDLYCLAFSCLEMLMGQQKFESMFEGVGPNALDADIAWMRWHTSAKSYEPVKRLVPGAPDDLAAALDAMLNKQVAERPSSAKDAFKKLQSHKFVPVKVVDEPVRKSKGSTEKKQPRPTAAVGASVKSKAVKQKPDTAAATPTKSPRQLAREKAATERAAKKEAAQRAAAEKAAAKQAARDKKRAQPKKKKSLASTLFTLFLLALLVLIPAGYFFRDELLKLIQPPPVPEYVVTFEFEPADVGRVNVTSDGIPLVVDSEGNWHLTAGDHLLEFSSGDYHGMMNVRVNENSNSFKVLLSEKSEPPVVPPGQIEIRFTVDPVDAELIADGQPVETRNGFGSLLIDQARQDEPIPVVVSHPDYDAFEQNKSLSEDDVVHIELQPWLTIEPAAAAVKLAGQLLQPAEDGRVLLPRQGEPYQITASHDGYSPFESSDLTFDRLRAQNFRIELTPDIDHVFHLAKEALAAERFEEAIDRFSVVLDHDHARYLIAFLLRAKAHQGRSADEEDIHHAIEDATAFLNEADSTATDAEKIEALLLRARVYRADEHFEDAVKDYRAALSLKSDGDVAKELAGLLFQLAMDDMAAGRLDPAITNFESVLILDPSIEGVNENLAEARYLRGLQKLETRDLGTAKDHFDRAIKLVDNVPKYYLARADSHAAFGEIEKGIEDYSTAIKLAEEPDASWFVYRAGLFRRQRQPDKALEDLNRAIELGPEVADFYLDRGKLYREDFGDFDNAIADFREALKLGFEPLFEINMLIGQTLFDAGEVLGKKRSFNLAIRKFGEAVEQYRVTAGLPDLSEDQVAQLDQENFATLRRQGDCYYATKDYENAIEQYTAAIDQSGGNDCESLVRRGNCLKSQGQFDQAEKDLRQALKVDGSFHIARFHLGQLYVKRGDDWASQRLNAAAGQRDRLKQKAVDDYQSAISELELLIRTNAQTRFFDLAIAACNQLNAVDTSPANAALIREWKQRKQRHKAGG